MFGLHVYRRFVIHIRPAVPLPAVPEVIYFLVIPSVQQTMNKPIFYYGQYRHDQHVMESEW